MAHKFQMLDADNFSNSCATCGRNREDNIHEERYIYLACYWLSDESDFNFLAAFELEEDAREYISRQVWKYLKTFVSKQPLY